MMKICMKIFLFFIISLTLFQNCKSQNSLRLVLPVEHTGTFGRGINDISAAGGKQSAYEAVLINGKPISNGAFTYSIIEYQKQHENEKDKLTVNQLKQYT